MRARTNFVAIANDLGASDKALALNESDYLAAIGLYVLSICYADRQRSDGSIPANAFRRAIAPGIDSAALVTALEEAGFVESLPGGQGWSIVGYLEWQRSKADIEAAIEQRRAAGRNGGRARASKDQDPEIDKTDRPIESRPLPHSLIEPSSEPSSEPLEGDAEEVRKAAKNRLTREEALPLIEQYGKERCIAVARQIIAHPPAEGVKSMPGFMRHQLERGGGEPPQTYSTERRPCFACDGTGRRNEGGESVVCDACKGTGR